MFNRSYSCFNSVACTIVCSSSFPLLLRFSSKEWLMVYACASFYFIFNAFSLNVLSFSRISSFNRLHCHLAFSYFASVVWRRSVCDFNSTCSRWFYWRNVSFCCRSESLCVLTDSSSVSIIYFSYLIWTSANSDWATFSFSCLSSAFKSEICFSAVCS